MAPGIIGCAFLRIIEDRIGFRDFLEAVLGAGLLVAVGMVFERQLPKGILDRLLIRLTRDAEHFVVVSFVGHRCATRSQGEAWADLLEHGFESVSLVALTSKTPLPNSMIVTSNVPPPKSMTAIRSSWLS